MKKYVEINNKDVIAHNILNIINDSEQLDKYNASRIHEDGNYEYIKLDRDINNYMIRKFSALIDHRILEQDSKYQINYILHQLWEFEYMINDNIDQERQRYIYEW